MDVDSTITYPVNLTDAILFPTNVMLSRCGENWTEQCNFLSVLVFSWNVSEVMFGQDASIREFSSVGSLNGVTVAE